MTDEEADLFPQAMTLMRDHDTAMTAQPMVADGELP
jgi:hypothetical protein